MSKQLMLALGAGGAATAAVVASAASLGSVDSTDLAAGTTVVAPCDANGIGVSYTTEFNAGSYKVASVTLTGVDDDCEAQDVKISLSDGTASLGEATQTAATFTGSADAKTADFDVDGLASAFPVASAVTSVAVVISG
jgi:hypothetical protein